MYEGIGLLPLTLGKRKQVKKKMLTLSYNDCMQGLVFQIILIGQAKKFVNNFDTPDIWRDIGRILQTVVWFAYVLNICGLCALRNRVDMYEPGIKIISYLERIILFSCITSHFVKKLFFLKLGSPEILRTG